MTRRKGERPILQMLDTWTDDHVVADMIRTRTYWFDAWVFQKSTHYGILSKRTGLTKARLEAISRGDRVSRAEIDALARAWSISANDLIASIPDKRIVVD